MAFLSGEPSELKRMLAMIWKAAFSLRSRTVPTSELRAMKVRSVVGLPGWTG